MTIDKEIDGNTMVLKLTGRLDTMSAPSLEAELKRSIGDISDLIFDLENLEYISSAGLRVLLSAQKVMAKQGKMLVRGANESVMEVFYVTGFADILTLA